MLHWHNAAPNPLLRQGFLNFQKIAPMLPIGRGDTIQPLHAARQSPLHLSDAQHHAMPLEQWLAQSETHAYLVVQRGQLLYSYYAHGMQPESPHALMSVSKSITGIVAGRLIIEGVVQAQRLVTDYLPRLRASAYRDVRVEHLWDMRSGVAFDAQTRNPHSDVNRLGTAIGWRPPDTADTPGHLWAFLESLQQRVAPPGTTFCYNDADTEVLARVLEAASGLPLPTLLEQQLWAPMGAAHEGQICVDATGVAVASAGVIASPMDLARLGLWLLSSPAENHPLPATTGPGYSQQLWVDAGLLAMQGNNGQSVMMLPDTGVVTVKLSAIPNDRPGVIDEAHRQARQMAKRHRVSQP